MISPLAHRLHRLSPAARWSAALLLTFVCGAGDFATGADVAFTSLYLAPISLGSWFGSKALGRACAVAASLCWLSTNALTGTGPLHPGVLAWNFGVELTVFWVVAEVVSRLGATLATERRLARTDSLTGLLSRLGFLDEAQRELERSRRLGTPLALAYFDLDGFKAVNDRHGHAAGDALLKRLGEEMRAALRGVDVVARLGGDEFALLLPDTDEATARQVVARLSARLSLALAGAGFEVGVSAGVADGAEAHGVEELLRLADQRMYALKSGRPRRSLSSAATAAAGAAARASSAA